MKYLVTGILILTSICSFSQQFQVELLGKGINSNFRGISAPSANVVWVSGSNGTVGRSVDGGQSWQWMSVPGHKSRDFRDIEAFDSLRAFIMAVDNPAVILRTVDGGRQWTPVFEKYLPGMFLDAITCINDSTCFGIGDPVYFSSDSSIAAFYLLYSMTANRWREMTSEIDEPASRQLLLPTGTNGESLFAASGTNLCILDAFNNEFAFVTGGKESNLYIVRRGKGQRKLKLPFIEGTASAGAFSLATDGRKSFYIAGGDYQSYWKDSGNIVYTINEGRTWQRSTAHGYRSCITRVNKDVFIACGTNGVDVSTDGCRSWRLVYGDGDRGTDGFNTATLSSDGSMVYFGGKGTIARMVLGRK